ncbi:hypothetical protein [uncultured Cytophaga sp.]|uniref:hypothetical protein n=1 Tax=uncultured Cytophaga sp. TaxID=160238 RepID=UPI00262FDE76|nr:hypothetical protein [uncultured Cytophaga sp.]
MIQIINQKLLLQIFNQLSPDSKAVFGKMSAQHMIEHLILTLKISSNKIPHPSYFREEKSQAIKQAIIYSPLEMPIGFKAPMLTDDLSPLLHTSLESAVTELMAELTYFNTFFKSNDAMKTMNPSMGELNYDEWIIFHNKHFTHHFKQFGLA